MTGVVSLQLGFNYGALPPAIATALQCSANCIRELTASTCIAIAKIGHELIAAKEKLSHGQFTPWLAAEFGMTERSAQRYMAAARWLADKSDIMSVLQPTTVYLLAAPSTPQSVQADVVSRIRFGAPLVETETRKLVQSAKEAVAKEKRAAAKARRSAKLTLDQQKAADDQEKRQQKKAEKERIAREHEEQERRLRTEEVAGILREGLSQDDLDRFILLTEDITFPWWSLKAALQCQKTDASPAEFDADGGYP